MPGLVIVRYGELGLKSPPVRREFERVLQRNILVQFVEAQHECRLRSDHGHLYVESDDASKAAGLARRVFGVTSVSVAVEMSSDLPTILHETVELADPHLLRGQSFAVRARRTGQHSFTSQHVAGEVGGAVLDRWKDRDLHVDLDNPDVEIFVEIRGPRTYVYFDRRQGPGGLPLGVAGSVVALVDGPRGALGAFLMMKRGCRATVVTTPSGEPLAHNVLRRFDPRLLVSLSMPDTDIERMLLEAAELQHADGLVLPLSVEEYPEARSRWGDRVVFSPTVGLTEAEVLGRWQGVEELLT